MALKEYNAIIETLHITKFIANRKRLNKVAEEMEKAKYKKHSLIEK
jgi:hypothetical protein